MAAALIVVACAASLGQEVPPQPAADDEITLPAPQLDGTVSLEAAIAARRSVREFADTPLTWEQIGQLAWAAQGITEPTRKLRAAPSAGGLYPLEVHFVTADGLLHYLPDRHKLQRLAKADLRPGLRAIAGSATSVAQAPVCVILTAVFERTAARFGERAEQYVYMEVGHAAQNLHLQAVALGLGSVPIGGLDPARVTEALSLPPDRRPLYVIPVGRPLTPPQPTP